VESKSGKMLPTLKPYWITTWENRIGYRNRRFDFWIPLVVQRALGNALIIWVAKIFDAVRAFPRFSLAIVQPFRGQLSLYGGGNR